MRKHVPASGVPPLLFTTVACALLAFFPGDTWAQRGAAGPPEHRAVVPVNLLPNPYVTQRNFGTLPDGRSWGSVSAVNIDIDGIHKFAPDGTFIMSFGQWGYGDGEFRAPHSLAMDSQ